MAKTCNGHDTEHDDVDDYDNKDATILEKKINSTAPFCFPGGALSFFLLVIMIPAPSGSHLKCLKCVKTYGKTSY
jgi:hypothetical protein